MLSRRLPSFLLVVLAMAAGPVALLLAVGSRDVSFSAQFHFWAIAAASAVAAAAAFALTAAGARRADGRTVLMGTAFAAMATLLLVHGVSTPGVLAKDNGVVAIAGAGVLPVGAVILTVSSHPRFGRPHSIGALLVTQAVLVTVIVALGVIGLLDPGLLPTVPATGSPEAVAVLIFGVALFLRVVVRSVNTWVLTRRRSDLLVVAGAVWLGIALFCQMLIPMMHLGWWIGHALEFAGIACVGFPVALDLYRDRQSRPLLGDLRAAELAAAEEAFLGVRVRALMLRIAEKDPSTELHTRRVARLAVEVGEELGLAPGRLRELAIGGLLHDMGKLRVPDEVLGKPGALDKEEFEIIKQHPRWGHDLLVELGGFSRAVHELVLHHHERLDGAGYPDGAAAAGLGLETRILTVCDVYDALVSDRVYRAAWSPERAFGLLHEESGSAYDPICVQALERVLGRVQDVVAPPTPLDRRRTVRRAALASTAALALVLATLGAAAAAGQQSVAKTSEENEYGPRPAQHAMPAPASAKPAPALHGGNYGY